MNDRYEGTRAMSLPIHIVRAWNRRWARPNPDALARVAHLEPAIVVTGASRGIGRALAARFAEAGENAVVLVGRDADALELALRAIRAVSPKTVAALPLDITEPDAGPRIDAFLAEQGLYVDMLINNAGVGLAGHFDGHAIADLDRLVALNVAALTRLMRHATGPMRDRARGGVLNVASLGGFLPGPHQAAYYASKAYVISLTLAVAHELGGSGVQVAVLAPGPVDTEFHSAMGADAARYRWLIPAHSPEGVARSAFRGFRWGHTIIVPGLVAWLLALAVRILPHWITAPLTGWLLEPRLRTDVPNH